MCLFFHYKYFVICIIFFLLLHIFLFQTCDIIKVSLSSFSCIFLLLYPIWHQTTESQSFCFMFLNLLLCKMLFCTCYNFTVMLASRLQFYFSDCIRKWNQIFKQQQIQFVEDFYHILVILFSCCWRRKTFLRLLNFWFIFFFYRIWRNVCTLMAMNSRKEIAYNVKL